MGGNEGLILKTEWRGRKRGHSGANLWILEGDQHKEKLKERKAHGRWHMNNQQSLLAGTKKLRRRMARDPGRRHGKVESYFPKAKIER